MNNLLLATLLSVVMSKETLRFDAVAEQEYRDSCGYSAVGTLLGIYWRLPFSESTLLETDAEKTGVAGETESAGRSLTVAGMLALIRGADLLTEAFRLTEEELQTAARDFAPVVVHFAKPQKHYALLLAAEPEQVILADPSRGLIALSRRRFLKLWSGVAVLATDSEGHTPDGATLDRAVAVIQGRTRLLERHVWR